MERKNYDGKYLKVRGRWYYYYRHIPTRLRPFFPGKTIRLALKTRSPEIAAMRRDELAEADDQYWAQLRLSLDLEAAGQTMETGIARQHYKIAKARAMAAGFRYRPMDELADPSQIEEVVRRVLAVRDKAVSDNPVDRSIVDAVLGGVEAPATKVSEAMEIYKDKIAVGNLINKSPEQTALWHATKDRSLKYFVDVIGDLPMSEITREHAQSYFAWWNLTNQPLSLQRGNWRYSEGDSEGPGSSG